MRNGELPASWLDDVVAARVAHPTGVTAVLALAQRGDVVHGAPGDLAETRAPSSADGGIVR